MTYEEMLKCVVKDGITRIYRVQFANGRYDRVRIYASTNGEQVLVMRPRSRKFGIDAIHLCSEYRSIEPILEKEVDLYKRARKRIERAVESLSGSGLWTDMLTCLRKLLDDEDLLRELCSVKDFFNEVYCKRDGKYKDLSPWLSVIDNLINMKRNPIVTLAFNRWDKEEETAYIDKAIKGRKCYHHKWRNGYDNSVDVEVGKDGKLRGWYSREYKGCCNGHYYYLLDEKYAVFGEDD